MAQDWLADVRKYAPDADPEVVANIAEHCGPGLGDRDGSLVAFSDPDEVARVRDGFCRKVLGQTGSDGEIDTAIIGVRERMAGDSTRNRVTVYYLLAETFGKLGLFAVGATAPAAASPSVATPQPLGAPLGGTSSPPVPEAVPIAASPAPRMPVAPPGANAQLHAITRNEGRPRGDNVVLPGCALLGAIFLAAAGLSTLVGSRTIPVVAAADADLTSPVVVTPSAVAPAAASVAIPAGAGVTAQDMAGRPGLSVYFDTARSEVTPEFAAAAAPLKAWIDSHPGDRLGVSGFNDSRGNAAFNAELSKNRAQAVGAALARLGVPATSIDLDKPPETTDTQTTLTNARRVDVVVKGAS